MFPVYFEHPNQSTNRYRLLWDPLRHSVNNTVKWHYYVHYYFKVRGGKYVYSEMYLLKEIGHEAHWSRRSQVWLRSRSVNNTVKWQYLVTTEWSENIKMHQIERQGRQYQWQLYTFWNCILLSVTHNGNFMSNVDWGEGKSTMFTRITHTFCTCKHCDSTIILMIRI